MQLNGKEITFDAEKFATMWADMKYDTSLYAKILNGLCDDQRTALILSVLELQNLLGGSATETAFYCGIESGIYYAINFILKPIDEKATTAVE